MCCHSSPLFASAAIAVKICEGAARNSALATRKRLTTSHSSNPPRTDTAPHPPRRVKGGPPSPRSPGAPPLPPAPPAPRRHSFCEKFLLVCPTSRRHVGALHTNALQLNRSAGSHPAARSARGRSSLRCRR